MNSLITIMSLSVIKKFILINEEFEPQEALNLIYCQDVYRVQYIGIV